MSAQPAMPDTVVAPARPALPHGRLLLIAAVAFVVRVLWIREMNLVLEVEGAEYGRIGENLLAGRGYVGMFGGAQTLFPPLYPLLIGLVGKLAGATDRAEHWISCISGVALVWPVYALMRRLCNETTAWVAAWLVALHGMLVGASGSGYSESFYFALWVPGLYYAVCVLEDHRLRDALLAGLFFGLAYLVRPEGVAYALLTAVFLLGLAAAGRVRGTDALRAGVAVVAVTAVLAAPYIAWLSVHSGYFRWEGKSLSNAIIAQRMREGLSYLDASRGLTADAGPAGPYLFDDGFDLRVSPGAGSSTGMLLKTLTSEALPRVVRAVRSLVWERAIGGAPLLGLALLGAAVALVRGPNRWSILFVMAAGGSYVAPLLSLQFPFPRHLFPLTLSALLWGAAGLATLAGAAAWLPLPSRLRAALPVAVMVAGVAVVAVPSVRAASDLGDFDQARNVALRTAGEWIRAQRTGRIRLMTVSPVLSFYAGADVAFLPWADEARALRYIHGRGPDFIALRTAYASQAPYIAGWLQSGIPDACATERRRFPDDAEDDDGHAAGEIVIYEWTCRGGGAG